MGGQAFKFDYWSNGGMASAVGYYMAGHVVNERGFFMCDDGDVLNKTPVWRCEEKAECVNEGEAGS